MGGPGTTWPLVGRDEELDVIAAGIEGDEVGAVVVSGAAGVGKSRVVAEAADRAADRGLAPRRVAATRAAASVPLGAFTPILPEVGTSPAPIGLIRAAADALVDDAPAPLVLAVDDAHLLDELSAALVHHLVATRSAFVIAGVRTGEPTPDAVVKLWKDGLADRIELPALSRAETIELLEAALGGPADGGTRQRVWEASAGNPLYLRELVVGAIDTGALAEAEGIWRWTGAVPVAPRLVELLEERLASLADAERSALEVVALAEPAPVRVLRSLVGSHTLAAAERHGLLDSVDRTGGPELRLSHPLYGELLRARMPAVTAAETKARLADALEANGAVGADDSLRIATWRLEAGTPQEPAALVAAAQRGAARFDFRLAERLARAAVEAGAGAAGARALADAQVGLGEYGDAERQLEAAAGLAGGDAERVEVAIARAGNLYWHLGRADRAIEVLDDAERETGDERARETLVATRSSFVLFEGRTDEAVSIASALVAGGSEIRPAAWQAAMTAGWGLACTGRLDSSLALLDRFISRASDDGEGPPPFALFWLRTARFTTLCFAGRFDEGIVAGEAAYAAAVGSGSDIGRSMHAFALGWCARMQGRAATAARWLREAVASLREVDMFRQLSSALGELAHAEAILGGARAAEAALGDAEAVRVESFRMDEWAIGLGRAALAAARGEMSDALASAVATAEATGAHGQRFMQAMALHDALRYGADDVAGELAALAAEIDGALVDAFAAHAEAKRAGDPGALADAAEDFARLGAWLYAAEAAASASRAFREEGRAASARSAAARSAALADRCEGATTPLLGAPEESIELTRREREVASMAARGLSNREIAERLVVSVRTVENHLRSTYGKLGVSGREELAPMLGFDGSGT